MDRFERLGVISERAVILDLHSNMDRFERLTTLPFSSTKEAFTFQYG